MKILLLAPQPFYTERGTPIAVRLAVTTLCRAGHEVDVLTYHEGVDFELANLRLMRIRKPPLVANVPIGFSWKKLVCDLWLTAAAYRRLLAKRYDVVHAVEESVFPALLARAFARFRLVYDMDSLMLDQLVAKRPWLAAARPALSWFERTAVERADLVLAVCPALADHARQLASAANVQIVPDVAFPLPPGIIEAPAAPAASDDLRGLFGANRALALYVGNFESYQGIDLLLTSLAAMPPAARCNLAVVGGEDASRRHHLARADALGLAQCVRFTGPRPLERLPELLAQADIVCSPRLSGQNTPMKIYSYLASGRAILATDIVSHTQVLDLSCACLVAPTVEAFSAGLSRLLHDPELRRRLGENAARVARENYSFEAFERRLLTAYDSLQPLAADTTRY